jgi:hypothetical protein
LLSRAGGRLIRVAQDNLRLRCTVSSLSSGALIWRHRSGRLPRVGDDRATVGPLDCFRDGSPNT